MPVNLKESTDIDKCLKTLFSLSSLEQVEQVVVPTNQGYSGSQAKYTICLNNGTTKHVFVNKAVKGATEPFNKFRRFALENETAMYNTFLPDIFSFLDEHGGLSTDVINSCFVKYYGNFETDTAEYLVLEDFRFRENKYSVRGPWGNNISLAETEFIFKRLGTLYGIFYAWKELKYPNASAEEISELHPSFLRMEPINDAVNFFFGQAVTTGAGSVIVKIIRSLLEEPPINPKLKSSCNLESLDRFVNTMPDLVLLYRHLQRPLANPWCPTSGDVHTGNIALTENGDDVVFFDFGIFQLSSVLFDFQRYTGTVDSLDPHTDQLLGAYISSFVESAKQFDVAVSSELLLSEYHRTKPCWMLIRFLTCFVSLKLKDMETGKFDEDDLVERVNRADTTTVAGRKEVVEALDKTDYGNFTGWMMVNGVVNLVNKVAGELTELEDLIANTELRGPPCMIFM